MTLFDKNIMNYNYVNIYFIKGIKIVLVIGHMYTYLYYILNYYFRSLNAQKNHRYP